MREAKELRIETLPPALIRGTRGRAAMNADSVSGALAFLGRLIAEQSAIEQVDLNPVLSYGDCCTAVDARIILSKKK